MARPESKHKFYFAAILALALGSVPAPSALAAEVWSGPMIFFSRPASVDASAALYQDRITDAVWITRGSTRGLFNAAVEERFLAGSPADTRWAWELGGFNIGLDITASNFENLTFSAWRAAHLSRPPNTVGIPGVLLLQSDAAYLDIEFLSWAPRGRGAFSYMRSTPGGPRACGDLDLDSDVDPDDISRLRRHLIDPDAFPLAPAETSCPVIGVQSNCDVLDLAVMIRSVADPLLEPGIAAACPAVN